MPTTTVSAKMARLEERLGVTLIRRTTRQLHVTPAGRRYYEFCARALAEISTAERELEGAAQEPSGLLHVTTPSDLGQTLLVPVIERFLDSWPKASIKVTVTNRMMDFVAEGVDLAVRVGPLEDSSLVVRKFRSGRLALWAAPSYLQRRGTPRTIAELSGNEFVHFSRLASRLVLHSRTGRGAAIDCEGRIASDDLDNIRTFALRGNGICALPEFIGEELTPSLVRILPSHASEAITVYFAYPTQRFMPPAVRAFIATATGQQA